MTKHEFVVPLTPQLFENQLSEHENIMGDGAFPSREAFVSVRPSIIKENEIKNEAQKLFLIPPKFDLDKLKQFVLGSFCESVKLCASLARDPIGGSNSFLFVPLIKLMNQLLIMNIFDENDLNMIMIYSNPQKFTDRRGYIISEGLLNQNLHDEIKYEICRLLNSMCDYLLRFRIESVISFSSDFVKELQTDQKRRYNELKASTLPSAIMAKKTKEFRCPAKDQMHALVNFKASENAQIDLSEDIKGNLESFHQLLNKACQIKERSEEDTSDQDSQKNKGFLSRAFKFLFSAQSDEEAAAAAAVAEAETEVAFGLDSPKPKRNFSKNISKKFEQILILFFQTNYVLFLFTDLLSQIITEHVIDWAKKAYITNEELIREMFFLVYRQYNSLNEVISLFLF